jgi:hypothetical protein
LLEQNMATHKFTIGQDSHFSPGLGEDSRSKGRYKVIRQLPEIGNSADRREAGQID